MQITCNTPSAYHVQHVMSHVVGRVSSAVQFDNAEHFTWSDHHVLTVDPRWLCGKASTSGEGNPEFVGWLLTCLTSQQQDSVSQGRICTDNFTCCHTEIEVAGQTFYLTQSQYTDTSPSVDPITPGAWQGSHWSANY